MKLQKNGGKGGPYMSRPIDERNTMNLVQFVHIYTVSELRIRMLPIQAYVGIVNNAEQHCSQLTYSYPSVLAN